MKDKLREVTIAVVPIVILVLLIHWFLVPLSMTQLNLFFLGALLVLIGLAIFLLGVDISVSRMGYLLGQGLTKKGKISYILLGGLFIGFIVSIAEPSLTILGYQIQEMSHNALRQFTVIMVVSLGVAAALAVGLLRIIFNWDIRRIVMLGYLIIFAVSFFVEEAIFTFAFDSSGATTGALTVPFVLAMSSGVSDLFSNDSEDEERSFGLVGIASIGPIIAMLLLGVFNKGNLSGDFPEPVTKELSIMRVLLSELGDSIHQVILGALPLVLIFVLYHFFISRQSKQTFKDIMFGLGYLMFGLVLFLTGVSAGFMPIGQHLGMALFHEHSMFIMVMIGFILGVMAILAEPAVYVLIDQIEDTTGGTISRTLVLILIAVGVGVAIALTILRVLIPALRLWHILLPGYFLVLLFSRFVPKLFVGMGFDSGGVASGPMTGTFIFAFVQGISIANPTANPIIDGFGMIALVAMVPILFIELLGFVYVLISRNQQD
ncbi:DUF1538 domain-containing protein [Aerococcaceae bacterium zg-ZJ1578]|uniref:DUF1538 domain-containing protein n=1 Tax=Aerococcaceae bacterium zg-252 TaxID=2796928 RepID=UPI001A288327|nr:DUF1538 domain-containing protein [Aerococcaceae bacterium zg-1578]